MRHLATRGGESEHLAADLAEQDLAILDDAVYDLAGSERLCVPHRYPVRDQHPLGSSSFGNGGGGKPVMKSGTWPAPAGGFRS